MEVSVKVGVRECLLEIKFFTASFQGQVLVGKILTDIIMKEWRIFFHFMKVSFYIQEFLKDMIGEVHYSFTSLTYMYSN